MATRIPDELYQRYLRSLLAGDRTDCRSIVAEVLDADTPLLILYTDLLQRSMYEIGELWERHVVSVATEHLATAITEHLLTLSYPKLFAHPRTGRTAIVACVANEYHQIGGRMAADYLEMHGWDTHFLGANLPIDDLLSMIDQRKPTAVGLSAAVRESLPRLEQTLAAIDRRFPGLQIMVGGQAIHCSNPLPDLPPAATYVPSLAGLDRILEETQRAH